MSANDDMPLSVPSGPSLIQDSTGPVSVETFNPERLAAGYRHDRKSVLIPEKAHLIGELEVIEYQIDHPGEDDDVDTLIDRFQELVEEFQSAQRFWTFEGRSPEWLKRFRDEFAKQQGIKLRNKEPMSERDAVILVSGQMVHQVVEVKSLETGEVVSDVTLAYIVEIYDNNTPLWALLNETMKAANQELPQSASVLTRDFSRRSSTGRSGTAS